MIGVRPLLPLLPLLLLLLASAAARAEEPASEADGPVWLRGSGDEVWIERDGTVSDPNPHRAGFTRVATSAMPGVTAMPEVVEVIAPSCFPGPALVVMPRPIPPHIVARARAAQAYARASRGVTFGPVTARDYDRADDYRRYEARRNYQVNRYWARESYEVSRRRYQQYHRTSHRRGRYN